MKRWNWDRVCEGFFWGTLVTAAAILMWACAMPAGNARQATLDHNSVSVPVEANLKAQIAEQVQAGLANFETRIGSIEASLVGPVSVGPIGGTHVGGDQTTVDSLTAQILAKTIKWSVLIAVVTVALYVLMHRYRLPRCMLDWAKGKPTEDTAGTRPSPCPLPEGEGESRKFPPCSQSSGTEELN